MTMFRLKRSTKSISMMMQNGSIRAAICWREETSTMPRNASQTLKDSTSSKESKRIKSKSKPIISCTELLRTKRIF